MEFLHPNVFYILMIPIIFLFILIITTKNGIEKHFAQNILEKLSVKSKMINKKGRNFLYFMVLLLFIIALSRPVIDEKEHNIKQNLIPIVIALDVSKSMLATDIFPNRIEMAKKKLQGIIEKAKNTTIGVVLFAKDSYVLSPVTEDFISLAYIIDNLDTNVNFTNGSNIFSLLEATKYMLEDYQVKNLIILSDGGNDSSYEEELEYAKENSIVVYSIGMATKQGAPIPDKNGYITNKNGDIVTVKLNESIKQFSLKSGGGYIDFTLDDADLLAILARINSQSKKEELSLQKIKTYTELFYYPLALGIFLLLVALSSFPSLRLKNKHSFLLFFALSASFTIPRPIYAYTFNFESIEKANEAYKNKEYDKASGNYRKVTTNPQSFYNLANSLYKEKKYDDAIKAYENVVTTDKDLESKKLHNLGNSYVQKNDLEKAKEFYEKALKIKEDKETRENLEIVNNELEKKENEKKENSKDQNKKNKDNQEKENQKKENQESDKKNNSQDNKNKQNEESKNSEKKENEQNKEDKDQKSENEQNKKDKDSKNEENKKVDKSSKTQEQSSNSKNQKMQNEPISMREEKKWMKMLENGQTPIYLQKIDTQKGKGNDEEQPW